MLPSDYQQKIDRDTNDVHAQHRDQQIQLINDFAKAREKFSNDWKYAANDADLKIENIKNRVAQEYTTNQLDSVGNYWNEYENDISTARESDKFIDNYLLGSDQPVLEFNLKTSGGVVESDNFIQSYIGMTGPSIHEVFDSGKDVDDSAIQSDQFLQSYLDGDQVNEEENEFRKKSAIMKEAKASDIFLEKYLLGDF